MKIHTHKGKGMKIAITSTGSSLDAEVDPRFGRCQYFIIADPETLAFEAVENSAAISAGGAGIASGQMIAGKGVKAVLTGNCGPNAYQVLSSAGIQVITGVSGKVKDAMDMYKMGKYQETSKPTVGAHFGMGMGRSGAGMGSPVNNEMSAVTEARSLEKEILELKSQAGKLMEQLREIQNRIEELEKKHRKGEV
jgi:predicted Fe-Mo cluster-binding NifX family protein